MQYLELIANRGIHSTYRIGGDYQGNVERFVVSTKETRDICNKPEIVGLDYTDKLQQAAVYALQGTELAGRLYDVPARQHCDFTFLRGGLNFGLRKALGKAYSINDPSSAFMSSQREMVDGRWRIPYDGDSSKIVQAEQNVIKFGLETIVEWAKIDGVIEK